MYVSYQVNFSLIFFHFKSLRISYMYTFWFCLFWQYQPATLSLQFLPIFPFSCSPSNFIPPFKVHWLKSILSLCPGCRTAHQSLGHITETTSLKGGASWVLWGFWLAWSCVPTESSWVQWPVVSRGHFHNLPWPLVLTMLPPPLLQSCLGAVGKGETLKCFFRDGHITVSHSLY